MVNGIALSIQNGWNECGGPLLFARRWMGNNLKRGFGVPPKMKIHEKKIFLVISKMSVACQSGITITSLLEGFPSAVIYMTIAPFLM